jgi:L-threonylcarbamoyladenylate synthase
MKVFHSRSISESAFSEILSILNNGGVIGFPTDTSYGLGADPLNATAIARIFEIKGRAESKPIPVLVDSISMAESIMKGNARFREVGERFWPGPLTMITEAIATLPSSLTAGTGTVGLRWPDASFATSLIRRFGRPLTATSANKSGMPSTISAGEMRAQLNDSLDALIDGGVLPYRQGSTLLDLTCDPPVFLREGPISFEVLWEFFQGKIRKRVA